ncbi:MAG TPA: outer membrane beta-barrel protein [Steroidobacteraceae bacterium]|nr:outer membrane beta-barrel protein [Steroidobacteraceae bacterium]
MNRRITFALRTAAALALVAGSWSLTCPPALADSQQGLSLGGGVGQYYLRITNAASLGSALDNYQATNDTAWQAFGQYRFAPFLALEAQYMNLGTSRSFAGPTEFTSDIKGWAPWLVATLPLGSTKGQVIGPFELFIKGGEYFYQYHNDYVTPAGVFRYYSNNYQHFVYGGGVGLVFIQRLDVRLEYDELHIQDTNRSNALWLTAAFNF